VNDAALPSSDRFDQPMAKVILLPTFQHGEIPVTRCSPSHAEREITKRAGCEAEMSRDLDDGIFRAFEKEKVVEVGPFAANDVVEMSSG
jgi:hypothetical protein